MESTIGERLSILRRDKKLTQEAIEELTGIDHTTISAYETNKRKPSIENLKTLARLYKVSTDYILCYSDKRMIDTTDIDDNTYYKILTLLDKATIKK